MSFDDASWGSIGSPGVLYLRGEALDDVDVLLHGVFLGGALALLPGVPLRLPLEVEHAGTRCGGGSGVSGAIGGDPVASGVKKRGGGDGDAPVLTSPMLACLNQP